MYKPSKAGKMIGVSRRTVLNWIDHEQLKHLFSAEARNEGSRALNENDLFIVNTINFLRDNGTRDWDEIAEQIEGGYRITDLSLAASEVDTGRTPSELFAKTLALSQERDLAIEQRDKAIKDLNSLRDQHKEELKQLREEIEDRYDETIDKMQGRHNDTIKELQDQINRLNRELGRLEGRLDDKE